MSCSSPRALAALIALLAAHAALIWMPPVNNEFAFAEAAGYFGSGDPRLLESYFAFQANTLGLPAAAAAQLQLLPGLPALWALRLASLAGAIVLAIAVAKIARSLDEAESTLLALVVLANPLVWAYSGRGTADLLPAAMGVLALAFTVAQPLGAARAALAGTLFGVAAVLKYHALVLLPVALLVYFARHLRVPGALALVMLVLTAIVPVAAYVIAVQRAFGFWFTPPGFQQMLSPSAAGALTNFACYAGYLAVLVLPALVFVAPVRRLLFRRPAVVAGVALVSFAIGALLLRDNGEMNFGPLDRWLPQPLRMGLLALAASGLLLPPLLASEPGQGARLRPRLALWLSCVLVLAMLCWTRPAQRYLLFVLPLFVLAIEPRWLLARAALLPMLAVFAMANGFIEYSRWCTGTAAQRMVEQIEQRGLLAATDPGAIAAHAGGPFLRARRGPVLYAVVDGRPANALWVASAGREPLARHYALVTLAPR